MHKRSLALLSLLLILSAMVGTRTFAATTVDGKEYIDTVLTPEPYAEKASYKLVRGLTNVVTSPVEIPKQIVVTTQKQGPLGSVVGLFKGITMTVVRAGFGVWETAFFLFPNSLDGDFSPILNPEFVWDTPDPTQQ